MAMYIDDSLVISEYEHIINELLPRKAHLW